MKIKELINNDDNLFSYIDYFKDLDTNLYWNEFSIYFVNHVLYEDMEEFINQQGIEELGKIFNLRSKDWAKIENISDSINTPINELEKVIETKQGQSTGKDETTRTGNDTTNNKYVSFDEVESDTDKAIKDNTESIINNSDNEDNYTLTKTKTGYNENYYKFVTDMFRTYEPYRFRIYKDIVVTLALQIY